MGAHHESQVPSHDMPNQQLHGFTCMVDVTVLPSPRDGVSLLQLTMRDMRARKAEGGSGWSVTPVVEEASSLLSAPFYYTQAANGQVSSVFYSQDELPEVPCFACG